MRSALLRSLVRRVIHALVLVLAVSSAALLLVHLAPGDAFSSFDVDPAVAAVERSRLGLDRPFLVQYTQWLGRLATLDFGESVRFHRPVRALLAERMENTILLAVAALVVALGLGLPAGIVTASTPGRWWSRLIAASSLLLVSMPPLVTALVLLLIGAQSGWLPAGTIQSLPLPALALALPIAASLERLQSQAMTDALRHPSIAAARARGVPAGRVIWSHAWRLSLTPVLGVLGLVIGTVLSGSFAVEIVMSWPGLGDLMFEALVGRDVFLAAGCAVVGALFLACGLVAADLALMLSDPRVSEPA